jgi:hypothetical protein
MPKEGRIAVSGAMRGLRWRVAWALVALAVVGMWWYASGGAGYILQVDYSWTGDMLEGADVIIDGEVAGVLERRSGQYVTGFRVDAGEHQVSVRTGECAGRPEAVTMDGRNRRVVFMADLREGVQNGAFRCTVVLRR